MANSFYYFDSFLTDFVVNTKILTKTPKFTLFKLIQMCIYAAAIHV